MSALLIIPPLIIISAFYGAGDVTMIVQGAVHCNKLLIAASSDLFGDTLPTWNKTLVVFYKYGDSQVYTEIVQEGITLNITYFPGVQPSPQVYNAGVNILSSVYGIKDVTTDVQAIVLQGNETLSASNGAFGDPWPNVFKTFMAVDRLPSGVIKSKLVLENDILELN